jgi:hypothetical protein
MPTFGDDVTVRALVTMPGVEQGQVLVVQWGPRLEKLVRCDRYALIEPAPAPALERSELPDQAAEPPSEAGPRPGESSGPGEGPTTAKRRAR